MNSQRSNQTGFFLYFFGITLVSIVLFGCCQLGFSCYDLHVWGEPELKEADIYLDNKLIKSSASGDIFLKIPYDQHEIKVIQKGFKPFTTILEGGPGRIERRLLVKLEPLDSVPASPSSQSDTTKSVK